MYSITKKKGFSFGKLSSTLLSICCGFIIVGALAVTGGIEIAGFKPPQARAAFFCAWILALIPVCSLSSTLASGK